MIRSFPKKLGLTISCKKTKSLAVMTQLPKVQCLTTLFQKVSQSKRSPTFSTWAVLCRMTVEWTQISSRICKASLPSSHFHVSCGINARSRPAPRLRSSTASSSQTCYTTWRALSSLCLLCAVSSPLWSIVCRDFC